jgi:hypothetical protein
MDMNLNDNDSQYTQKELAGQVLCRKIISFLYFIDKLDLSTECASNLLAMPVRQDRQAWHRYNLQRVEGFLTGTELRGVDHPVSCSKSSLCGCSRQ